MKKIAFVLLLAFIFTGTYAQFGIKLGTNTASFKITSPNQAFQQANQAKWGVNAGIFYRIKILMVYVQPEAYFSSTGGNFSYTDPNTGIAEIHTLDLNRIDIPLLAGVKLGLIRINAGPVGFLTLSDKSDLDGFKADLKGMTWGYQAGIGFDLLKKLTFDARYEGSLSDISNNVDVPGIGTLKPSTKVSAFLLSVGLFF